ncbi:MAG: hypothetical protein FJ271_13720 [Planctomycetes bacterium]|nr:hypothetical protein [Planctomycetota bacterium]
MSLANTGTMRFQLPTRLSADELQELELTCVAGGQDNMPFPAELSFQPGEMAVVRSQEESGNVLVPWNVEGAGQVMARTASLMERDRPYQLALELVRGKLNQVRGQASDWGMGGLESTPELDALIRQATRGFGRVSTLDAVEPDSAAAERVLGDCYRAAEHLVATYTNQVFRLRHERQPRLDTLLLCRLGLTPPAEAAAAELKRAFNAVMIPFPWNRIEPSEGEFCWDEIDRLLHWAQGCGVPVLGGPLVDFSGPSLPDWLWQHELDSSSLASALCCFADAALRRYRGRIPVWQLASACNYSQVLGRSDDELLWLTMRLFECAHHVDADLQFIVSVAQPWGEYLATQNDCNSPFLFVDNLLRSGMRPASLDLEVVMGCGPRGSYCRDTLEFSRLIDLYSMLGVPLQITLGYPSQPGPDPLADPDMRLSAGHWRGGFTPEVQAEWAADFATLALCKPSVQAVQWVHWSDAEPHLFPHAGLVDAQGNIKPALAPLARLRQQQLRV